MSLSTIEKQIIEKLFQMEGGYVLDFSDRTMEEFFGNDLGIQIYDEKYNYSSGSKANRIRGFIKESSNSEISRVIFALIQYIENKIILGDFKKEDFPEERISMVKKIAVKLSDELVSSADVIVDADKVLSSEKSIETEAFLDHDSIQITLNKAIFGHVKSLLESGHYYNAVEESYKIVRESLRLKTGEEQAHKAFSEQNKSKIFDDKIVSGAESDFRDGVKFLHLAIQNLRNEKAHTPAKEIDKNLALHYIVLAGLAYDLIN